jgi:hypothetical protein
MEIHSDVVSLSPFLYFTSMRSTSSVVISDYFKSAASVGSTD